MPSKGAGSSSAEDSPATLLAPPNGPAGCTWCVTCATARRCSKPTGPPCAASRPWTTATRTVYGRQESWEDSPPGWPQQCSYLRTDGGPPGWPPVSVWPGGRPIAQWPRLQAGRSDDLGTGNDGRQDDPGGRPHRDAWA